MAILTASIRDTIERSVLCWLATSDAHGHPNVSPKEIFYTAKGTDHLLIADIASPISVANIKAQNAVCVSLVDIFEQKGVKLTGRANIVGPSDHEFDPIAAPLLSKAGPDFPIRHAIVIEVERARPIIAPSFTFKPDQSDESRRHSAYAAYGVTPKTDGAFLP